MDSRLEWKAEHPFCSMLESSFVIKSLYSSVCVVCFCSSISRLSDVSQDNDTQQQQHRQNVQDEGRNGCPSGSTNENNVARVQDMMYLNDGEASKSNSEEKFLQNRAEMEKAVQQFLTSQNTKFYHNDFLKLFASNGK
ncbi:hypothetical protein TNCV_620251 [Trichonephila clavipes]|nr:hypothetical protein TNCV_620251 [Trichonephila clavipes]